MLLLVRDRPSKPTTGMRLSALGLYRDHGSHSGMLKEQKDSLWVAWQREGACSKSGRPGGAPKVQASRSRGTGAAEQLSRETDHTVDGSAAVLSHGDHA